jgi:hypothetical protein
MPWYYAGPEAKPVGPLTLEEIYARRMSGAITPETYIIEQPAADGVTPAWRRFREILPAFPPPPAHPLFPSAAQVPLARPLPIPPPVIEPHAAPHGHYSVRPTNKACAWGFGLGILSFVLCFACGLGLLVALPALVVCILGFAEVQHRGDQSGRGMAAAGAVLAAVAIIISIIFLAFAIPAMIRNNSQADTQQSSD